MVLVLAVFLVVGAVPSNSQKSVKLSLYYQTFCVDCAVFIVDQLYPTWLHYGERLRIDIVPFGSVMYTFDLLQACAIHVSCGPNGTLDCLASNLRKAMDYLRCAEKNDKTLANHIKCANASRVDLQAVNQCATGALGDHLEEKYVAQAHAVKPKIHNIPRIHFNDSFNETVQKEAQADLMDVVYSYLKEEKK